MPHQMRRRRALALGALELFLCISLSVAWSAGFSNRIAFRQLKYATQTQATVSEEDAAAGYGYEDDNEEELSDEDLAASMGEWDEKIARFNTVHLTGRIGATPEAKYFDDGKVVVNVNLATKRKYNVNERKAFDIKSGDEATDWYGLEIWGQTAEFVAKYVDKGARVGVVGQLQVDTWIDRTSGESRNKAKIVVRDLDVLETRAEADLRRGGGQRGGGSSQFYGDDEDEGGYERPSRAGSGGFFDN